MPHSKKNQTHAHFSPLGDGKTFVSYSRYQTCLLLIGLKRYRAAAGLFFKMPPKMNFAKNARKMLWLTFLKLVGIILHAVKGMTTPFIISFCNMQPTSSL